MTAYRSIVIDPSVSDLAAGFAGEHLVAADLLLQGYRALMAEQHCPYDILVDLPGRRVARIQVKSVRVARTDGINQQRPAYIWPIKRAGKGGRRRYSEDEFDVLACVALDIRLIAYIPATLGQQHVQVRVPGYTPPEFDGRGHRWPVTPGREFCELTFERAASLL